MTVASMADDRTAMRSDAEMTQGSSGNSPEVIFVTSFLPFPVDHGGAMAREGFIRALSACASVNVLVLTSIQYDDAVIAAADAHYTQFCRSFRCHRFPDLSPDRALLAKTWDYLRGYPRNGFWSEEAAAILEHRILSSRCQVVWCDSVFNAKYLAQAKRLNCRTVLTNHNVESDLVGAPASATGVARFKSWLNRLDLRRLERLGARLADVVTAITGEDLKYYRRLKDDRHALLLGYSYPVDPTISDSNGQEPGMICFVGSMNWPPNVRAARYLVHEIMPLVWKSEPGAKCYIVGKNPPKEVTDLQSSNVVVTGEVASLQDYYRRAQVVTAPLLEGGGLKIKVVEALACGKAVVTTKIGAAGLNVENGKHVVVAESASSFADAIVRLLQDDEARERTAAAALNFAVENLSPSNTERQVRAILDRLQC